MVTIVEFTDGELVTGEDPVSFDAPSSSTASASAPPSSNYLPRVVDTTEDDAEVPVPVLVAVPVPVPVAVPVAAEVDVPVAVPVAQVAVPVAVDGAAVGEHEVQLDPVVGEDGFTLVRSRRYGRVRGMYPEGPYVSPPDRVCLNEVPWFPKAGPLRATMKWAQARKGKYIGTRDGPGYFVYGSYGPNANLEY